MRTIRIALWSVVGLVAAMLLAVGVGVARAPEATITNAVADIGGPFTLIDQNGKTVTRDDLLGTPHAVFFGYTFCPDVCPTTMWEMGEWVKRLEKEGKGPVTPVFVSVDPERDTPEVLADYVSAFDRRIVALTGTREAVDEAVSAFRAHYTINAPDERGDVLIDHTASVLLFDAAGRFRGTIAYGEDPDVAFQKLGNLAA